MRIAARSLGPVERGTRRRLEPRAHLVRHDLPERGLAQPRRPAEQQVVDRLAALARSRRSAARAAPSPVPGPTNSSSVFGRSATSNSGSSGRAAASMSRSLVHHRPTRCNASFSSSSTGRSSTSRPLTAPLASCGVSPSARSASRTSASGPPTIRSPSRAHAIAQIEHHALRDLLADAGHHRQRDDVAGDDRAAERIGRERRQERQRDLRPDAGHAGQQVEQLALVGRPEAVEQHRVVADDHARVDPGATPDRRQRGERRRRHQHVVADARARRRRRARPPSRRSRPPGTRSSRLRARRRGGEPGAHHVGHGDRDRVGGVGLGGDVGEPVDADERRADLRLVGARRIP